MSDFFSLRRLVLLLHSDLVLKMRSITIFSITIFSVLFLYDILFAGSRYVVGFHDVLYSIFLFVGGFFVSSHVFFDLHDKTQGITFLTLPASHFEKLFSRWLIVALGYALGISFLFFFLFAITNVAKALFFPSIWSGALLYVNWHAMLISLKYYLLLQPIFLLGAIYFKQAALAKTVLCCCVFMLALIFVKFFFTFLFFTPDNISNSIMVWQEHSFFIINSFLMLLAPICLFATYLRLRESEI